MESQEKKDRPVFERSIMLTRFKLSQQKREIKEKNQSSKVLKSPKSKKQKTPIKNKEKLKINVNDEYHPNKLKRKKIVKKIVLKPKKDLKVIDWNDDKRKRMGIKTKPSNIRTETNPTSDIEGTSSLDSDVSFDEVIRRADDELDDEGLMEILTCPSPVWWEDPPDGNYMEGPIIIQTNTLTSMPDLVPSCRRKKARKRTPQKIVKEEFKNDSINENPLQNNLTNKTIDSKFNSKRNKLEDLLSAMKNKLKNTENTVKEIKKEDVFEDNKEEGKPEIADISGDSAYIDISIFDNEILKHLENIKIPIEDIEQAKSKQINSPKQKHYKHKAFYTKKSKSSQKSQIEKSQTEKSQTENLNILDIGNVKINLESLKHIKNLKIGIPYCIKKEEK
ncbi:PREDICTED: uncharacterized protein LOC106109756 [Papilio polytes]|uniref:uncharacterized protein LOC106109756 n=1 Tax=Papilio polytes TaxID=76194 RepID=UPI000675CD79|nr:PREDICTED: uncharacterized protein LOC106109756 [Papilio polytes]